MDVYGLVLTIVVLVAIAVLVMLFEKKRATRIESDLKQMRKRSRPRDD